MKTYLAAAAAIASAGSVSAGPFCRPCQPTCCTTVSRVVYCQPCPTVVRVVPAPAPLPHVVMPTPVVPPGAGGPNPPPPTRTAPPAHGAKLVPAITIDANGKETILPPAPVKLPEKKKVEAPSPFQVEPPPK